MPIPLNLNFAQYHAWVLYPALDTQDPWLQYYYDFSQSLGEYRRVFADLGMEWTWQPVQLDNAREVIRHIATAPGGRIPLVLNLCDGDELNGAPGLSVIRELEQSDLHYTGADAWFYEITTSKIPMKQALDRAGVPNAPWELLDPQHGARPGICERLGSPLLLKPAVSGGSLGISLRNLAGSEQELNRRAAELRQGFHGWDLISGGLLAERFIEGPEYTSLVVGNAAEPGSCVVYEPVERIFHPSLGPRERFLSFERLWDMFESETPLPQQESLYVYAPVTDPALRDEITSLSLQAYAALSGTGYGRLDLRRDAATGRLYVLEVNAQCGLSEDEAYTSIGAILRLSGISFTDLIASVLEEALLRHSYRQSASL
ncbi:MAG TPA: hypothetical protein VG870_03945 [Chitinophagaceae bacterium]|nr:hypothetical protein [Chitinophagaceae bacterium]